MKFIAMIAGARRHRVWAGTCHDNLFFDSGTLSPPRVLGGRPRGAAR